ncbi:hypothetical protein [Nostoc sp. PA-18-2419]|uniref:hypothetical protein n=1 Tax=Nostoc sp. PA-18-2419 TaxID=2575443 RepID=UPI0016749893|nr:hypothetical protein [Nostoc sp. PA-18-2419]
MRYSGFEKNQFEDTVTGREHYFKRAIAPFLPELKLIMQQWTIASSRKLALIN